MKAYRAAVKEAGLLEVCARCGFADSRVLEVHHKDRDRSNNDIGNLETLCPNCHKSEHYGNKRRGKRKPRKPRETPAKRLIALRIPDELADRLEARCSIRKQGKTEVLIEAIERGWDESGPFIDEQRSPDKPAIEPLRAICAGEVPGPEPDSTPVCCECGKPLRAKMYKGVAVEWACGDLGCPMYGTRVQAKGEKI
jgi:hypothetical protein